MRGSGARVAVAALCLAALLLALALPLSDVLPATLAAPLPEVARVLEAGAAPPRAGEEPRTAPRRPCDARGPPSLG